MTMPLGYEDHIIWCESEMNYIAMLFFL